MNHLGQFSCTNPQEEWARALKKLFGHSRAVECEGPGITGAKPSAAPSTAVRSCWDFKTRTCNSVSVWFVIECREEACLKFAPYPATIWRIFSNEKSFESVLNFKRSERNQGPVASVQDGTFGAQCSSSVGFSQLFPAIFDR